MFKMSSVLLILFVSCVVVSRAQDLRELEFERDPDEVMIAQESRHYHTVVQAPVKIVKPSGVTNSHRPQYNLDSLENDSLEEFFSPPARSVVKNYKSTSSLRGKEALVQDALARATVRREQAGRLAQVVPILRAMSGAQRRALAGLVAAHLAPPARAPLSLQQVRSMFGSSSNSSELMLPILLDMAALLRRSAHPGKETREVTQPYPPYPAPAALPPQQLLRRSDAGDTYMDTHTSLKPEDTNQQTNSNIIQDVTEKTHEILKQAHIENKNNVAVSTEANKQLDKQSTNNKQLDKQSTNNKQLDKQSTNGKITTAQILRRLRSKEKPTNAKVEMPKLLRRSYTEDDVENDMFELGVQPASTQSSNTQKVSQTQRNTEIKSNLGQDNNTKPNDRENSNLTNNTDNRNLTRYSLPPAPPAGAAQASISRSLAVDNSSLDLMADSSNTTLAQDLPVAERLRALNRYVDRKGNLIRRGTYPPKPYTAPVTRRPALEPAGGAAGAGAVSRWRPPPARKPPPTAPAVDTKCELFTNTLCLHADDYPTEAIVSSLRRNKAAAGALLADFQDPGQGALDGVSAAQEAKYTADHYLVSNRRGDTANRDFASAGEAGFMCPSTVKYARPQRARATSGHWKYIVNTGEHTQTLRLEKCLKPKDSCTYLTDNFKSKCVQVYNYHRLLTWDQQNGLHMDIFKVPTCCSCHIEGYSVSFPPLGHRIHETSSEHFPGEDLSSETGNHAFEAVQSTIQRPTITKSPSFIHSKPESFPPFTDNNPNLISVSPFNKAKLTDNDDTGPGNSNPVDSYGNSYFPDSFNQASSIRNVRRPLSARNPTTTNADSVTLPSYLEPPTQSASNSFTFVKEPPTKFKTQNTGSPFKRGAFRPNRRPIRKKISGGPDDLMPQGTSAVESFTSSNMDTVENFGEYQEDPQIGQASVVTNTHHQINHPPPHNIRPTIGPKLQAVTTENISTTAKPQEVQPNINEHFTSNGKRINYNYHPIIDFFGESEKGAEDESIDREDSDSYIAPVESEWKPMNQPPRSSNLVGRKKHK